MKLSMKIFVVFISIICVLAVTLVYFDYLPKAAQFKLVVITGDSQIAEINQISTAIIIQRQDLSGKPITSGALTVNLATNSSSGKFYDSPSSSSLITNITIPNSQSSVPVYFSDSEIGKPTLTMSAIGFNSTSTTLTLTPNQYIAISYSYKTAQSTVDNNGDIRVPNSDSIYLIMNITMTNNGYNEPVSTQSSGFNPVANGRQDFRYVTFLSLSDWNWTLSLSDGDSYSGMLVFEVPKSLSNASFSLNFKTLPSSPYVLWSQIEY